MKQIVINSKNGAENIRLSRLATRASNLDEDKQTWQILAQTPCSKRFPIYKNKNGRQVKDTGYAEAMSVGSTISQRIATRYADIFGVQSEEGVTKEMIQQMASDYLQWPLNAQLLVCRDPSRQTIDEEVQIATLKKYLPTAQVDKPTNGDLTLVNGDIVKKSKGAKVDARSIDIVVNTNTGIEFNLFAKYFAVAGSGQSHQALESVNFVKEAIKYVDKHKHTNDNDKYFIVLIDGAEAETHIPELNDMVKAHPTIFAGNCESVIAFIESK